MRKSLKSLSLCLALFAGTSAPAFPFRMIQNTGVGRFTRGSLVTCTDSRGFLHWNARRISWSYNSARQGSGKAAALTNALNAWTNVASADYTLTLAGTTRSGFATDGINNFVWAKGNGCSGSCLAITALVVRAGQVIIETDVSFNDSKSWGSGGLTFDTQAVATHEVGHSLGIHHTNLTSFPRPTMYAFYAGSGGRTLESDDQKALQCSERRYPRPVAIFKDGFEGGSTAAWSLRAP